MPVNTQGVPISQGGGSPVPTGGAAGTPLPTTTGQATSKATLQANGGVYQGQDGNYYYNYDSSPAPKPNPNQTASEPTVLSSETAEETNQNNSAKLASINNNPPGQVVGATGFIHNADQSFAEAPSGAQQVQDPSTGSTYWTLNGMNYAIGPLGAGQITSDPTVQAIYDQFTTLKSQMDATGAANIAAIQQEYQALIKQQQQTNAGAEAGTRSLLIRGGAGQSASSAGINQAQISYGLQQISDLTAKENSAIVAAQQAQEQNDYQLLDEQLKIAQQARTDSQAAAQKLSDTIIAARNNAALNTAVLTAISNGDVQPADILKTLQAQGYTTISAKDVGDALSSLDPQQQAIYNMMQSAAANGAPADVIKKIGQTRTMGDAITAAGQWVTDPTSPAGMYQAAVRAGYTGTPGDFAAAQKYKEAYAAGTASALAAQAAVSLPKYQNTLEQQGRQVILKELSNRSGGLGLQDNKVNLAIHLRALFNQYAKTVTVPNTATQGGLPNQRVPGTHTETVYNVPPAQYEELVMGLANLVSPTGNVSEADRQALMSHTAAGDIAGAIQYITGSPQTGNTQAILQNMYDSIDRQGTVAEAERQTYLDNMDALLPADLSADRRAQLISATNLNSFTNPQNNALGKASPDQIDQQAYDAIQSWSQQDPKNAALLSDISKQFPDLSNTEVAQKLGLIPAPTQ